MADALSSPWLAVVTIIITGLFGVGGLAALLRVRLDRKNSIAQQEVAEDDAIAQRWQAIVQAQTEALVAPLRASVSDLQAKVEKLEGDLRTSRSKYWRSIVYIRQLLAFLSKQLPEGVEPPPAPPEILEDI
jgi:hypothetical protein